MGFSYERECSRFQTGCIQADIKRLLWKEMQFTPDHFSEFGYQVFSQWDEDGLIQYLISKLDIPNKVFVEFGIENYEESNTKFLLMHDDWKGLVMDSSEENIRYLKRCNIYWKHSLNAVSAFITPENINELIEKNAWGGVDIGLLSIDIDGNDYYVWDAISCISPRIVICEVNPYFGYKEALAIPYTETFDRTKAHYSNLYWGASLKAFKELADKKGYKLACINSAGTNVFFVREDVMTMPEVSLEAAWKEPAFRESRNENGELTFLNYKEGLKLIEDMELLDLKEGRKKKIKECVFYKEKFAAGD